MKVFNRIALLLFFGVAVVTAHATVPQRRTVVRIQSDSTRLTAQRVTNGKILFYATSDGWALLPDGRGNLCYAIDQGDGTYQASDMLAHMESTRSETENLFVRSQAVPVDQAYTAMLEATRSSFHRATRLTTSLLPNGMGQKGVTANGELPSVGSPVIPVVMVEFPDISFSLTDEQELDRQLNAADYTNEEGAAGSLRQYFVDQSYGSFTPTFRIVGRVKVSHNHDYYGANSGATIDANAMELAREVASLLNAEGIDASPFTVEGSVPLLFMYYAGEGEQSAYGSDAEEFIWAHFNNTASNIRIGGTPLDAYLVVNELMYAYPTEYEKGDCYLNGIGTAAHELCHALGLPDAYDTQGVTPTSPLSYWSLMDAGGYWNNGYTPMGLTAYERNNLGWLDIPTLTEAGRYELQSLAAGEGPRAYRIVNPRSDDKEYYILENRQPDTWFPSAMGTGMLVTHVDYNAAAWSNNTVNTDPTRLRYTYIPADNAKQDEFAPSSDFRGDLYPGTSGNRELSDESSPAAAVNTGGYMGQPLYHIEETNGVVSFSFLDASITAIDDAARLDGTVDVYTVSGVRLMESVDPAKARTGLEKGVYLLKDKHNHTQKITVK